MMIDLPLIKTLLLNLPFNQPLNNFTFLSQTNAKYSKLKCQGCKTLWGMKMDLNPVSMIKLRSFPLKIIGFAGYNYGFPKIDELGQNKLCKSGINPLQIGYGVEDFEVGAPGKHDFENGDDHGGKGDGGYGSGGNDGNNGNEPSDSEPNDRLSGLEWWWLWQWNRAIRARKRTQITLHLSCNNRGQLLDLAVQILTEELLLIRDMMKPTIVTKHVIKGLLSLLLQALFFSIIFPRILLQLQGTEPIIVATIYGILGASVIVTTVVSGAVVFGLWFLHNSLHKHGSNEDDTDS